VRATALVSVTILATFLAGPTPAAAQSVQDRIEQGLEAAGEPPSATQLPEAERLGIRATDDPGDMDVSLAPSSDTSRLRTTLDPTGVEQRIDKGLTAAGEDSAYPPDYAFGAFQRGWFLTAFSLALERAKQGDAVAQTLLGVLFSRGLGVKQDLAAAADWYRLAGKGGDPEGLYALGQAYLHGRGVDKDPKKAAELFRKAADKRHADAARELAYLLLDGKAGEKNPMLAAAYLSRAAHLGNMDAQYTLAGLFQEGVGVVPNEEQAAHWYAEAARNGHVGAQVEYAIMLFNGRGVEKDEAEAAQWFLRAANADNPVAQIRLARILAEGRGLPKDEAEAARWYLIAKERNLDDDFMEDWLRKLNPETREAAKKQAEAWARSRRGWALASVQPAGRPAPVDNALE
jgi:TPR repeat protein